MTNPRWFFAGVSMLAIAVVLVALAFTGTRTTSAAAQQPCGVEAQFTCTPVRKVNTATPTFTMTVEPSSTPIPPTAAPTQPPATATKPAGGTGGQAVVPPNTGSGPDAGFRFNVFMLLAAGAIAVMGGGSIVVAARRSRHAE